MKLSLNSIFSCSSGSNPVKKKSKEKPNTRSMSRSDMPSFGSNVSSSSATSSVSSKSTPRTVLPPLLRQNTSSRSSSSSAELTVLDLFGVFDRDGDGKITKQELELVLSRLGSEPPTEEEVVLMLAEADRDGDGCISLEDFGALGSALGTPASVLEQESELRDAFGIFDADGDGKISAEELLGVFLTLGDEAYTLEDCRRMICGVDSDGDGFVCFQDFVRMMDGQR